jgi:hypothetical protein
MLYGHFPIEKKSSNTIEILVDMDWLLLDRGVMLGWNHGLNPLASRNTKSKTKPTKLL